VNKKIFGLLVVLFSFSIVFGATIISNNHILSTFEGVLNQNSILESDHINYWKNTFIVAKYNTTTIFISHVLNLVSNIADQIAVIHQGKIVEKGTTKDIFSKPKHPYTKGLLGCRPPLDKRFKRLPLMEDFLNEDKKLLDYLLSSRNEILAEDQKRKQLDLTIQH